MSRMQEVVLPTFHKAFHHAKHRKPFSYFGSMRTFPSLLIHQYIDSGLYGNADKVATGSLLQHQKRSADIHLANNMIDIYMNNKVFEKAVDWFNKIPQLGFKRDLISYELIAYLVDSMYLSGKTAVDFIEMMREENIEPSLKVLLFLIKLCHERKDWEQVRMLNERYLRDKEIPLEYKEMIEDSIEREKKTKKYLESKTVM
ncbi:hypothetical protein ABK040_008188 [Willaertia magna]